MTRDLSLRLPEKLSKRVKNALSAVSIQLNLGEIHKTREKPSSGLIFVTLSIWS